MDRTAILSVSALTDLIKNQLESGFPSVAVEGELTGVKLASSGHLYFALKDREALIQAVMFRSRLAAGTFEPKDGQKVVAHGALSVYKPRGSYQIVVNSMRPSGLGDLLAAIERLKARLAAEGLFDPARKRPLPRFPGRVGVVTSPSGAAFRDILNVLARRNASVDIVLLPVPVQGEEAAARIAGRIKQANRLGLADVLIVGRGGGSAEDLLAFSDERVVRAIAASGIPVISAVGHEIDWALSDFAADVRAPTPSAAAELVSESAQALAVSIAQAVHILESAISARIARARQAAETFSPERIGSRFVTFLSPYERRLDEALERFPSAMRAKLLEAGHRIALGTRAFELANPRAVLARGYSIVQRNAKAHDGLKRSIVRSSEELAPLDELYIEFSQGAARAQVMEKE